MKAYAKKTYGKKGDAVVKKNWDADRHRDLRSARGEGPGRVGQRDHRRCCRCRSRADRVLQQLRQADPRAGRRQAAAFPRLRRRRRCAHRHHQVREARHRREGSRVGLPENCIQCNQCSLVCPHAAIRPFARERGATAAAPAFVTKTAHGQAVRRQDSSACRSSPLDCTGCGNCVDVCPAKDKAPDHEAAGRRRRLKRRTGSTLRRMPEVEATISTRRPSRAASSCKPLFEFSGACAGCGETPYVKLVTQLFGDRMMVANATGCSSIYGGSAPTCSVHHQRRGPGPGLGELPVRGQRRVRLRHEPGHRRSAAPSWPRLVSSTLAGAAISRRRREG